MNLFFGFSVTEVFFAMSILQQLLEGDQLDFQKLQPADQMLSRLSLGRFMWLLQVQSGAVLGQAADLLLDLLDHLLNMKQRHISLCFCYSAVTAVTMIHVSCLQTLFWSLHTSTMSGENAWLNRKETNHRQSITTHHTSCLLSLTRTVHLVVKDSDMSRSWRKALVLFRQEELHVCKAFSSSELQPSFTSGWSWKSLFNVVRKEETGSTEIMR